MYEVRELLEIGKGDAPSPPYEVDDIIAAGRRRRWWSTARRIGGAGIAAAALVVLGLFIVNATVPPKDHTVQPAAPRVAIPPLSVHVSIFLTLGVSDDQIEAIDDKLKTDPLVSGEPQFFDQEASYQLFLQEMKNDPVLVRSVTPEQVPLSFRIELNDSAQFDQFAPAFPLWV